MSEPGRPIPVVAAVVRRGARYLVCRRPADKRHGGLWEFPGGKVLEGETHDEAVRRELSEELDLQAATVGLLLFSTSDEGAPFVIDFIETSALGVPVLHEHSEIGWFTAEELIGLPLAPADALFAATLTREAPSPTQK